MHAQKSQLKHSPWSQTTWQKKPCNSVQCIFFLSKDLKALPQYYRNHCHSFLNSDLYIKKSFLMERSLEIFGSSPVSIHGHFKLGCLEPCSVSFFVYQRTELPQAAKPVSVLNYPHSFGFF